MAAIDLTSGSASAYGSGELQLQGKVQMTTTPTAVTDNLNVASPLLLATNLVKVESTLRITTNDNPYIDAEDGAGNNRFTVGRDTSSQQVNVDFASNPSGSTTAVGAIRTYKDGVTLSEAMTFIENGYVGIGTNAPSGLLHVDGGSAIPRMILDADTNVARIFSFRTNNLPRWAFRVDGTESGTNTGSDLAIRRYDDTGAVIDAAMFISRATGNVGIGTTTPSQQLEIQKGAAGTGVKVSNTGGGFAQLAISSNATSIAELSFTNSLGITGGNVGIGTTTPYGKFDVRGGAISRTTTDFVPVTSGSVISLGLGASTGNTYGSIIVGNTGDSIAGNLVFAQFGGNVGIGTTTPSQKLEVAGVIKIGDGVLSGGGGVELSSEAFFGFAAQSNAYKFRNGTNTTTYAILDSEGLKFNGDTAAANALDDYEEGTWTPVYRQGGVNNTATYSYQFGTYTKIGNLVTAFFDIIALSITAGAGACELAGLPFVVSNNMAGYSYVPFRDPSALSTILTNAIGIGFTQRGTDYIAVRELNTITGQEAAITSWFTSGRLTGVLQYTV
jgi:hypothetical protein